MTANPKPKPKRKSLIKPSFFRGATYFGGALSISLGAACARPQVVTTPPSEIREDVTVKGLKVGVTRNCAVMFAAKSGKVINWKMPANGPCYFAKNKSGAIEIYKDMRKSRDSLGMILIHSAEIREDKECLGTNAGILIFKDRVQIQNPPYTKYSLCIDEKGAFDQKHYATSLNSLLQDSQPNILTFK